MIDRLCEYRRKEGGYTDLGQDAHLVKEAQKMKVGEFLTVPARLLAQSWLEDLGNIRMFLPLSNVCPILDGKSRLGKHGFRLSRKTMSQGDKEVFDGK